MGLVSDCIKKNEYKSLYLLYGEESFMRLHNKNALTKALVTEGDNLNYSYYEGASINPDEVAGTIMTMPFLAEKRVVVVENSGWLAPAKGQDSDEDRSSSKLQRLMDAVNDIAEDVVFIMVEEKADKRAKLFKTISSKGIAEEYTLLNEDRLANWLTRFAQGEGKKMSANTAYYLVSEVGPDMTLLFHEMEKLIAWAYDKDTITNDDVDTVCTHQVTNKIFDMISAISTHHQKQALDLYYDLITLRESPFAILALLTRQYMQMLSVKDCMNHNMPVGMIASKLGIKDWAVKRIQDSCRRMTAADIKKCLNACAEADEAIKTGNLTDSMSVELLIVSCSS